MMRKTNEWTKEEKKEFVNCVKKLIVAAASNKVNTPTLADKALEISERKIKEVDYSKLRVFVTKPKGVTCRGSIVLGSACMECEKCADDLSKLQKAALE